jgi:small subunit ribosomal protein S15
VDKDEVVDLIVQLRQRGHSTAEIGTILRDSYGVPSVRLATGKSVLDILREKDLVPSLPEDLVNLMRKAVGLHAHLQEHGKDLHNRRGLQLIEAKIRRLVAYYKDRGVLPADWEYSLKAAELQVK